MRYKIYLLNGPDAWHYYIDDKERAQLLYRMAINSKMFKFVQLSEMHEEAKILDEWLDANW